MSTVNDIQIGGRHYKKTAYQHWDFVCDADVHYLVGCATKYVSRWRDKNGVEDLEKAIHYADKAKSLGLTRPVRRKFGWRVFLHKFTAQLPEWEATAVTLLCEGRYDEARSLITQMINREILSR